MSTNVGWQQVQSIIVAPVKDQFALPSPVTSPKAPIVKRVPSASSLASQDDDGFELDAEDCDMAQDATMVRSPIGTHWVKAKKPYQLDTNYIIWYSCGHQKGKRSQDDYEKSLQCLGVVKSVQDFWRYWNAIDIDRLPDFSSLSVFKEPIKPMWEDAGNKAGGQWLLKSSGRTAMEELFTKMVLALIGGYFDCHESLCGAILTKKPMQSVSMGLWSGKSASSYARLYMEEELRELLGLEDEHPSFEFKEHHAKEVGQKQEAETPTG